MTDLIVHIGDAKCGSTSLQKSLFQSKDILHDIGIAYCVDIGLKSHADLLMLAGERTHYSLDDPETVARAEAKVKAIREQSQNCDYVLLSAESLFAFGPDTLRKVLDLIDVAFDRIQVACYIRPPTEKYLSLVQQLLKTQGTFPKPQKYRSQIAANLRVWRSAYEADSLYIRKFDRAHLEGGDITRDFCGFLQERTQRPLPQLSAIHANLSLSAEQIFLLQKVWQESKPGDRAQSALWSRKIISLFNKMNAGGLVGTKPRLSDAAKKSVDLRNYRDSEYLHREFPDFGFVAPTTESESAPKDAPWAHDDSIFAILAHYRQDVVDLLKLIVLSKGTEIAQPGTEGIQARVTRGLVALFPDRSEDLADAVAEYWRNIEPF